MYKVKSLGLGYHATLEVCDTLEQALEFCMTKLLDNNMLGIDIVGVFENNKCLFIYHHDPERSKGIKMLMKMCNKLGGK